MHPDCDHDLTVATAHAERQTHRKVDRQKSIKTDKQTDRQTNFSYKSYPSQQAKHKLSLRLNYN